MPISEIHNEDNMIGMARYPDKFFDLAIVDPPYGIGFGQFNRTNKDQSGNRFKANKYKNSDWDNLPPSLEYFSELRRVSKNQIIWGGNYFPDLWIEGCKGFIYWHKGNPVENFSDGELAWTSFDKPAKQFNYPYYGGISGNKQATPKIHPTQKPIALYSWILKKYGKPGDKILDTHLGSGSSRIAAYKLGFDFYGWELDEHYFNEQNKRFETETKEPLLKIISSQQTSLL